MSHRTHRTGAGILIAFACCAHLTSGCSHLRGANGAADTAATHRTALPTQLFLRGAKLAILLPVTGPDHERDRAIIASIFADALAKRRPDLPIIPLVTTLSAINQANLAALYDQLYVTNRDTTLFVPAALQRIATAVGARYLVQLHLESYDQESHGGVISAFGLSLRHRQTATLRLAAQIYDASDGKMVWESSSEGDKTKRSLFVVRTIQLDEVARAATEKLIDQLPL